MNRLPFFPLYTDILIPHPNNSYSFTCTIRKEHDPNLLIKNITLDGITYKDAFVLLPIDENKQPYEFATLCCLTGKVESGVTSDEIEATFFLIGIKKIIVQDFYDDLTLSFTVKKYEASNDLIEDIENLKSFIKTNSKLKELSSYLNLSKTAPRVELLNQLFGLMSASQERELEFYLSETLENKYCLLLKEIINYLDTKSLIGQDLLPNYVREKKEKEEQRLSNLNSTSSDYSATLDYLEVLESIPWNKYSDTSINLKIIEDDLNKNHYGLDEIKKNILEYFALEFLTKQQYGNVFLFVGPPGTGKTTIAKSIATATNREFIQVSLGGVSDESEVRGHRRTYVGSKPGRFVYSLTKCKTLNPIILLDEVDKVSSSNKGDPNAALLELLDPEQNKEFLDRYLEVPLDLSKCLFICTANKQEPISSPLLDRMEIIEFKDYSLEEKKVILDKYLIPSVCKNYMLSTYNISFTEDLKDILLKFSLRKIKKIVSRLYRYAAHTIVKENPSSIVIDIPVYEKLYKRKKERNFGFAKNIQS